MDAVVPYFLAVHGVSPRGEAIRGDLKANKFVDGDVCWELRGSIACNAPYAWLRVFNNACVDPTSPHTSPPASTRLLLYERFLVSISIVTYQSVKDFRRRKLAQINAFAQAFGVSTNGPMLIPSRKCFKEMPRIDAEVYAADRIFDEFTMSTKNVLVMLLLGFKDHRYQIHQSATKPV